MSNYFFGTQQSPPTATAASASPPRAQLCVSFAAEASSTTSPKSLANSSQSVASVTSLAERPFGSCVVQRIKVVLYT
ncbi:hypothetical protein VDGD_21417 [Verticillium dahliae]|nr:hypothetical protein VDGD_21417 [Verticillium dahliae]